MNDLNRLIVLMMGMLLILMVLIFRAVNPEAVEQPIDRGFITTLFGLLIITLALLKNDDSELDE